MESGHEDREYQATPAALPRTGAEPQWSPVMKTGNTWTRTRSPGSTRPASMEPGHEDREYDAAKVQGVIVRAGLNGARS